MFIQHRPLVWMTSIILLSTAVSGCFSSGSDNHQKNYPGPDDGSPGIKPSLSSVKLNFFETNNDYQYIGRMNTIIGTGRLSETTTPLYGKDNTDDNSANKIQYYLGDGFFTSYPHDKLPQIWLETDGVRKVKIKWQDNAYEYPSVNTETLEYIPIDLDGNAGVNAQAPIGIHTLLNELPNTRTQNFTFPIGSRCYVEKYTTKKPYFAFDSTDVTNYQTLEQWKRAENIPEGYSRFEPKQVGTSRNVDAVYFVAPDQVNNYQSDDGISRAYAAAVLYDGKVYNATYQTAGTTQPNTDSKTSLVTCDAYNSVAADFISAKIKQYYH